MILDKSVFKKHKGVSLNLGIRLSVDDLYVYHRELKDRFQYVYVDVSEMKMLDRKRFFTKFAGTYKLIIVSPKNVNAYDRSDNTFARTIYYAKELLDLSDNKIYGFVVNLDRHYYISKEKAYNTVENVFLKRVLPLYSRIGCHLMINISHNGPLTEDVFSMSYGLKSVRMNKGLELVLDTLSAYKMGAKFITGEKSSAVRSLSKNYSMVELSGIGKKGQRTSIRECIHTTSGLYIEFLKVFKKSIIILSANDVESAIGDWEYIKKYLGKERHT